MELQELGQLIRHGDPRFRDDPFRDIQAGTDAHRAAHACWAYPYDGGRKLGAVAAATGAQRLLELGYGAWLYRPLVGPWRARRGRRYDRT